MLLPPDCGLPGRFGLDGSALCQTGKRTVTHLAERHSLLQARGCIPDALLTNDTPYLRTRDWQIWT